MIGPRFSRIVRPLLAAGILCAASEFGLRAITSTNPQTGVRLIGRMALLPYRPEAAAVLAARAARDPARAYIVRDADLGWSIKPNASTRSGVEYTATADGLRGPRGWTTTRSIPPGKIRISVYGDSFAFGAGVPLKDTWPDRLQGLRGDLQILNFGVPAYGTDQALLRFRRDGRKFQAQLQILEIYIDDVCRNLNVVRFYLEPSEGLGNSKPRFALASGKL